MSDTEDLMQDTGEEGADETLQTFEEQKRRNEAKLEDEMEEYKAVRAAEKEKEANDIEELKKRKKERAIQRAEEEKRMSEQRKEEDARRKVEEEERKKKKAEDEDRRRREKERRRLEAEKRKAPKTPNFTIVKKEGEKNKDEGEKKSPQKTKEELEKEKQAALTSRIQPLADTGNMNTDQLVEIARDLHEQIREIVTNMYNNDDRYKRQQYDIVELQERARAQSKTKKKGVSAVQIDDSYDRMNDRFSNAPPKILVANKYEANLDRRPWNERLDQFGKEDFDVSLKQFYAFA